MRKFTLIIAAAIILLLSSAHISLAGRALEGKTLYLQCNVWFEQPMKINAINYHKGTLLRAGTKVKVEKMTSSKIEFVTLKNGLEYRILFSRKYFPGIDIDEYAGWYFGPDDPLSGSTYSGFSSVEKKGIEEGALKKGMSRKAVLMAYGYPPRHRTRSLDESTWSYWNNRLFRMEVRFGKDGRIVQIIGGGH